MGNLLTRTMAKGEAMSYVFAAIVFLIWIGLFIASANLLLDTISFGDGWFENDLLNIGLGIAGLIICIASLIWVVTSSDSKPCAKYETMWQYNAATKTTMPMRYCAVEGEWVK